MTALGVVLAAQAMNAALRPSRTSWLPRFAATAAVWVGLAAVVWPDDAGSLGIVWGTVLVGWGFTFAFCTELERTRRASASDPG